MEETKQEITTLTAVGTGAAMNIALGFVPRYVRVYNPTAVLMLEWQEGMTAGHGLKSAAAAHSVITSNGISPYAGTAEVKLSGTIATTKDSAILTGSSTKFLSELKPDDVILIKSGTVGSAADERRVVKQVISDTSVVVDLPADRTASGKDGFNMSGIKAGFTLGTDAVNGAGNTLYIKAVK